MKPGQKIRILTTAPATGDEPKADKKAKQKAPKVPVEMVATVTTPEQLASAYKKGEWNEITIIANGNHLQHFINGTLTADVTDTDPEKGAKAGVLALQLHKGQAMTIEFKDIRLKTLP
jgi:ACT domain-containing protein